MRLRWEPGGAELTVENDGVTEAPAAAGGHGLTGMRERAALLGGELEVGGDGGRFRVRLRVPAGGVPPQPSPAGPATRQSPALALPGKRPAT